MNKKRNLRVISLILVISMIFVATSVWSVDEINDAAAIDENNVAAVEGIFFPEDLFQDEAFMMSMYEYLVNKYGEDNLRNLGRARANADMIFSLSEEGIRGENIYPDFFGGMYINEDRNLVVLVVDDMVSKSRASTDYIRFSGMVGTADGIIVRSVDFTYNELNSAMEIIRDFRRVNPDCEIIGNVVSNGVRPSRNRVVVRLRIYNEEQIARFRDTVSDSPIFTFIEFPYDVGCLKGTPF